MTVHANKLMSFKPNGKMENENEMKKDNDLLSAK